MSAPTPPKCGPINKLLLTPCRRPGLSRKVRTPLQQASPQYQPLNIVKTEPDNKLVQIKSGSHDFSTIPAQAKDIPQNVKTDSRTHENSSKEIKKTVERDKVKGTRSNSIVNNDQNTLQSIKSKLNSKKEKVLKSNDFFDKETVTSPSQKDEHKFSPEKVENRKGSGILKVVNCELNQNVKSELKVIATSENVNLNDQIGSKAKFVEKKEVKSKRLVKRLSMKRSTSNNDSISDLEDYPSPIDSVQLESNNLNGTASKAKKPRIDVQDLDISLDTITDIQHRIKIKKEKLRQLQQAETYKKIHNRDELEKLIGVWKNGCRRALDQLHQKLQSHAPISMEHLVKKFNIPQDIIDNLS